jgi:hypothetical protein
MSSSTAATAAGINGDDDTWTLGYLKQHIAKVINPVANSVNQQPIDKLYDKSVRQRVLAAHPAKNIDSLIHIHIWDIQIISWTGTWHYRIFSTLCLSSYDVLS